MRSNSAILDDARKMDREALAAIFDQYAPALFKFALRFCSDVQVADQVVGDTFFKLLEHLSAGSGPKSNLRSYLFETAYHLLVDEVRYSQRRIALDALDFHRYDDQPVHIHSEQQIFYESVSQAIEKELTDYQRHVIILRFFEGFSLGETAAILGKSINVVKAAQHHAVGKLRRAIA